MDSKVERSGQEVVTYYHKIQSEHSLMIHFNSAHPLPFLYSKQLFSKGPHTMYAFLVF
jgi:hypothetical protein